MQLVHATDGHLCVWETRIRVATDGAWNLLLGALLSYNNQSVFLK